MQLNAKKRYRISHVVFPLSLSVVVVPIKKTTFRGNPGNKGSSTSRLDLIKDIPNPYLIEINVHKQGVDEFNRKIINYRPVIL